MKKVIAVSTLAMAGMFSAQTLADENKTGFYVTGKAGVSVMSLSEQRFVDGEGHGRINTKAVTKVIRFLAQALRWDTIFISTTMCRCVLKWSFMAAVTLNQNIV